MFPLTKVILKFNNKKSILFHRDKYGYYLEPVDEKKYRETRTSFRIPVDKDKWYTIEEHEVSTHYHIGHVEMRNLADQAGIATVYYMKNGQEKHCVFLDACDIEITIEDGLYCPN